MVSDGEVSVGVCEPRVQTGKQELPAERNRWCGALARRKTPWLLRAKCVVLFMLNFAFAKLQFESYRT